MDQGLKKDTIIAIIIILIADVAIWQSKSDKIMKIQTQTYVMDKYKFKGGKGQSYKFKGAKVQTCIEGCVNSRVQNLH